ncbi:unnamed protein product [Larinioides sclopetarius]|uniref:Protein kinase domain-containing protein n=1 Tax=Larinioides sclopetarius TaxID=280406 RepID=A0AAV2AR07_9ARAC
MFQLQKSCKDGGKVTTVIATPGQGSDRPLEVCYTDTKVIGNGSFGVVYQARLLESGELVAIKKVLQDKRFKNRELQIMRKLNHCNIVKLKYFFYSGGEKKEEVYLNLVLEYIPETVYRVARHYSKSKQTIPISYVKLYMYQLFRSLAYTHSLGICHRDIKPQNLLLDTETGILKLCDFGSAKHLVKGEPNVSYICSRYYRAPELIFGATDYTTMIDVWSGGCVLAELMLGQPIFPGDSGVDQLVEIIKVFRARTPPEAIELVSRLLEYTPSARITPLQACAHKFFDELRDPNTRAEDSAFPQLHPDSTPYPGSGRGGLGGGAPALCLLRHSVTREVWSLFSVVRRMLPPVYMSIAAPTCWTTPPARRSIWIRPFGRGTVQPSVSPAKRRLYRQE